MVRAVLKTRGEENIMRRKYSLILCCLGFVFTTQVDAGESNSDEENLETARKLFHIGTTRFQEARYVEAAEAFREAYELKPNWKLLYNLAQSEAASKRQAALAAAGRQESGHR